MTTKTTIRRLGLLLVAVGATLVAPTPGSAQRGAVVSKEVAVGRNDASLKLGFADSVAFDLELRDGSVRLNGENIGRYRTGDPLDAAWRELLEGAAPLDGAALADELRGWAPPTDMPADQGDLAARIDEALETALSHTTEADAPFVQTPSARMREGAMAALLRRPERMAELGQALADRVLDDADVHVGDDVVIGAGETVHQDVIVVDGDLDLRGEIDGDVVVVGGNLRLADGGRVTGDARVTDGSIIGDAGQVLGDVQVSREPDVDSRERGRTRAQQDARREIRGDDGSGGGGLMAPLRAFGRGLGDLIGSLFISLLIAVVGGGLAVHFAHDRLEVVAETARAAPLRAGMVGLAGAFLAIPAWILGGLGLIVTIVGILALPFWIVLFPLALCLALVLGYLGVAQNVGEWVAQKRYAKLTWVRASNPYTTVVAGVGALLFAFVASNAIDMLGFLGLISGLLVAFGVMTTVAAVLVGFGAVLLTRGGRPSRFGGVAGYWGDPWDDDRRDEDSV